MNSRAIELNARKDESTFRRDHPTLWLLTLWGPFVLTGGILLIVWAASGWDVVWRLLLTAVSTFFLFGKFVILGGSDGEVVAAPAFFNPKQLLVLVLYMDVMTVCLLAFHLGFLFRLPGVGAKLKHLAEDGQFILQSNPWMRRATFLGLAAFVLSPLPASGSVGGSILGRLLGLSPLGTFAGVTLGNVLAGVLMYLGGELITRYVGRDNPLLWVGGIAVIGAIVFVLNRRYRRIKARQIECVKNDPVGTPGD